MMRDRRWAWVGAIVCLGALGCGGGGKSDKEQLLIGAVIDLTGTNGSPSWRDAIELAIDQMNDAIEQTNFKDGRFEFGVQIQDSQQEPTLAIPRGIELVQQNGAIALIGGSSQNSRAFAQTYYDDDSSNDLGVPFQCGSCTSNSINNPDRPGDDAAGKADRDAEHWIYRSNMASSLISLVVVRNVMEKAPNRDGDINGDGVFKLATYAINESAGTSTLARVDSFARELDPNVVVEQIYFPVSENPDTYDFPADISRLLDDVTEIPQTTGCVQSEAGCVIDETTDVPPDAVVMMAFAQHYAGFWQAYVEAGASVPPTVFFHTARISAALTSLGALAEGLEGISHVLIDDPVSGADFESSFMAATGSPIQYRDSIFYDAAATFMLGTLLAVTDMDNPGDVTGAQVRDQMQATSQAGGTMVHSGVEGFAAAIDLIRQGMPIDYEGPSGPMDYDPDGNVRNKLAQFVVQDGVYMDVRKFDCVTDDNCDPI